jgi:DNA-binding NtrC family response regulator
VTSKQCRILIVDNQNVQSVMVERSLNRIGYYRIAVAASLEEADILLRLPDYRFNILIGCSELLGNYAENTFLTQKLADHTIIY